MKIDAQDLAAIVGARRPTDNMRSVLIGLDCYGYPRLGMGALPRLAAYVAQLGHESGRFRYDREIWGPTRAQRGYEGRRDLGNIERGDGRKFAGHGPLQITGRANTTEFHAWCKSRFQNVPDFIADPEQINSDPWEGISPLWYWEARGLNQYADRGDMEMLTRRINGRLNGYDDRLKIYTRAALYLLGYDVGDVYRFQLDASLTADNIAGPMTRGALHAAMRDADAVMVA